MCKPAFPKHLAAKPKNQNSEIMPCHAPRLCNYHCSVVQSVGWFAGALRCASKKRGNTLVTVLLSRAEWETIWERDGTFLFLACAHLPRYVERIVEVPVVRVDHVERIVEVRHYHVKHTFTWVCWSIRKGAGNPDGGQNCRGSTNPRCRALKLAVAKESRGPQTF